MCADVTPPVYCGRWALKLPLCVNSRPNTNIAMKHATPKPASTVTTLWNVRVGSSATTAISSSTMIEAMKPGVPVIVPVASVNQLFAPWKPPAPIPMIRAEIWRFLSTSGTSKAMIRTLAITSVHDSSQPRNGCRMRLENT